MSGSYNYDETAEVWPYFVITLASVVTIPCTLMALARFTAKDDPRSKASFTSRFTPFKQVGIDRFKAKAKRSKLMTKL